MLLHSAVLSFVLYILTCKRLLSIITKFKTHGSNTHFCSSKTFTFHEHSGLLLIKGYLHYKTSFCHKIALDTQLMTFFI